MRQNRGAEMSCSLKAAFRSQCAVIRPFLAPREQTHLIKGIYWIKIAQHDGLFEWLAMFPVVDV